MAERYSISEQTVWKWRSRDEVHVRSHTPHRLQNQGHPVNQKRIRRLMRLMRLTPTYQKPNTRKRAEGHKTRPYLVGGVSEIDLDVLSKADLLSLRQ